MFFIIITRKRLNKLLHETHRSGLATGINFQKITQAKERGVIVSSYVDQHIKKVCEDNGLGELVK